MIVSDNKQPNIEEFSTLVYKTNDFLNDEAKTKNSYFKTRDGRALELDVLEAMRKMSEGTAFENTIELVSGQKFPDIVANKYYGVEVKSSKDDHWTTTGNSVLESTRVDGVERIFLTFGKLADPIEFKSRPYEDCLSEVVVTHYPRYKIDMNLQQGQTIFNKIDITYDELRSSANPVSSIIEYYRSQLKEGESLWWIDNKESVEAATPVKIRLWRTLSAEEKKNFIIEGFALFPELIQDGSKKYEQFSLWLVSKYGVVSTSLRDSFTAGGRGNILSSSGLLLENVPQIFSRLNVLSSNVAFYILKTDEATLKQTWGVNEIASDRISQWIAVAAKNNETNKTILNAIFGC